MKACILIGDFRGKSCSSTRSLTHCLSHKRPSTRIASRWRLALLQPEFLFSTRFGPKPAVWHCPQVFVSTQPAVGGLPEQIRQGKLCISPRAGIHLVILDESRQAEAFIEFANKQQTAVGSHSRSLKIDAQKPVEGELKGLISAFTHWVSTSGRLPYARFTHEHARYISSTPLLPIFKSGIRAHTISYRSRQRPIVSSPIWLFWFPASPSSLARAQAIPAARRP